MSPTVLIILDGWGIRREKKHNAILEAKTPFFNQLLQTYPHTEIEASGLAVGLPEGIMGNSEVGHMNLGAGRIVYTGLSQIYQAIEDRSFFENKALLLACEQAKKNNSSLHLMGLLSDGAVHSHQDHLYALLDLAKMSGVKEVFVHAFMDGRDTPPASGLHYISQLEEVMKKKGIGKIASISGRFYAMDRDKRWERIEKAFEAIAGISEKKEKSAHRALEESYAHGVTDEFVIPVTITNTKGEAVGPVSDSDSIIFFNFRADRAREMTQVFTDSSFNGFHKKVSPKIGAYVCMALYDEKFNLPVAFQANFPKKVFGEIVSEKKLRQLRIAETEKYAHVTFFFSGGREEVFPGEERILIPSPREVPTYDLKPEMSALKITQEVLKKLSDFDVIIMNFANPDMVGHTAQENPITKAIETVDSCLSQIVTQVLNLGGNVVITADHGNAEENVDANGNPHTAHTLNPVPFILVSNHFKKASLQNGGRLCDVAPTLLQIMGIEKPIEMTGKSLINQ